MYICRKREAIQLSIQQKISSKSWSYCSSENWHTPAHSTTVELRSPMLNEETKRQNYVIVKVYREGLKAGKTNILSKINWEIPLGRCGSLARIEAVHDRLLEYKYRFISRFGLLRAYSGLGSLCWCIERSVLHAACAFVSLACLDMRQKGGALSYFQHSGKIGKNEVWAIVAIWTLKQKYWFIKPAGWKDFRRRYFENTSNSFFFLIHCCVWLWGQAVKF